MGTGFIYGDFYDKVEGQSIYKLYLVTNRHVIGSLKEIIIRVNPYDGSAAKEILLNLTSSTLSFHPDPLVDVAVLQLDANIFDQMTYNFFTSDELVFSKSSMLSAGVTEGDSVFVLGYPMGFVGEVRQDVILRRGSISRIRDFYENRSSDYIIDAFVFPGNSGGPVIIVPETTALTGTIANRRSALIGIVKAYIPYLDQAISPQTGRTRVVFEENTGLTKVESVDRIVEAIENLKNLQISMSKTSTPQKFIYQVKK